MRPSPSRPRHRAVRHAPLRSMLTVTSAVAGATLIGLGAAGSTYALWQTDAPLEGSTVTSGTIELKVNGQPSFNVEDLATTQLLPGRAVVSPTPLLLQNTGTTPMSVSIASVDLTDATAELSDGTVFLDHLSLVLREGATCTAIAEGEAGAVMSDPIDLDPGTSKSFCLQAGLSSQAPADVQGMSAGFTINLDAVQVRK